MTKAAHKPAMLYTVVEFRNAFTLLDQVDADPELPTVDIEALMSVMFYTFEKPLASAQQMQDTLNWLFEADGFSASLARDDPKRASLRRLFHVALIVMRDELNEINPYVNGRLIWRYVQRRGKYGAILATERASSSPPATGPFAH